jgi:hypothetical protein
VRLSFDLAERHHVGPATTQVRSGIDGIELNGNFRKLESSFCLFDVPEDTGMHEMLDVVHLHEAAVARREMRIFADRLAKDRDSALPAFRFEFRHEVLTAKPAIVDIERDVWFAGKPHQPFGG